MVGQLKPLLSVLDGWQRRIEQLSGRIASLMLAIIMFIVVLDVACRYLFNSPLVWSFDFITLYLTIGLFFFSLSDTLDNNDHVWVNVVTSRMPNRWRHLGLALGFLLSWLAFMAIAWMAAERCWNSYETKQVTAGTLQLPVWISSAFVAIGTTLLLVRITFRTVSHSASALFDESYIDFPREPTNHGTE